MHHAKLRRDVFVGWNEMWPALESRPRTAWQKARKVAGGRWPSQKPKTTPKLTVHTRTTYCCTSLHMDFIYYCCSVRLRLLNLLIMVYFQNNRLLFGGKRRASVLSCCHNNSRIKESALGRSENPYKTTFWADARTLPTNQVRVRTSYQY